MLHLEITRDSVAAGDDVDAPHRQRFSFAVGASLREFLAEIDKVGYLARIDGGKATWVVEAAVALAVVAQQWSDPVILPAGTTLTSLPAKIHFRYLAQQDPAQVVARLRA